MRGEYFSIRGQGKRSRELKLGARHADRLLGVDRQSMLVYGLCDRWTGFVGNFRII
jgi:hypothetical protein